MVFVPHSRPNNVGKFFAMVRKGPLHDPCGLDLFVVLAAVGNDGQVEEVASVVRDVVQSPQPLLVPGEVVGVEVVVAKCFGKARAGADGDPTIGVVGTYMPGTNIATTRACLILPPALLAFPGV